MAATIKKPVAPPRVDSTLHKGLQILETLAISPRSLGITELSALLELNPKQRAAIVLTVYDGLTHAEAAKALGCSETTVSWRIFAARKKLKRLLKNLEPRKASP